MFFTNASFAASQCGVDWLNELLNAHAVGHWALTLDADELLVYPLSERIGVRRLASFLDQVQAHALVAYMLDMYSRAPIRDTSYERGSPFLSACDYFDTGTYHQKDADGIPVRGGPRHGSFGRAGWTARSRRPF